MPSERLLLNVHVAGEGIPIVILPAFGLHGASMREAFDPAFAAVPDWSRMYVDLPGTGRSAAVRPTSDAVLESLVATVRGHLGTRTFLVAGWSYGGYLTTGLLWQFSGQVAGLLLAATGPHIRPADRNLRDVLPSIAEFGWLDAIPPTLHAHFREAIGRQSAEVAARVNRILSVNDPTDEEYLQALHREGLALAHESGWPPFAGPVSLIAGRHDRIAGFQSLFDALGGFPGGDLTVLCEAGHYLPLEEPDAFAVAVSSWLKRCATALVPSVG